MYLTTGVVYTFLMLLCVGELYGISQTEFTGEIVVGSLLIVFVWRRLQQRRRRVQAVPDRNDIRGLV